MFVTKRIISSKKYYYLEETINLYGERKKYSIYLSDPDSKDQLLQAYNDLKNKIAIEASRIVLKNKKVECLSASDIIELEKLRYDYKIFRRYFKESFSSFDQSEFVRFVQGSASVEGNSLSLLEAGLVVDKEIGIAGKSLFEIQEIINLKNVKQKIFSKKNTFSESFIKNIHHEVQNTFTKMLPGEYRPDAVYLSGSTYRPPAPNKVPKLMAELIKYYAQNKNTKYSVELAGYLHIYFESIHPFKDGNGRTGREILNYILLGNGFPRVIINLDNRNQYISLLERFQTEKDYNKFSRLICDLLLIRKKEVSQALEDGQDYLFKILKRKVSGKSIKYN